MLLKFKTFLDAKSVVLKLIAKDDRIWYAQEMLNTLFGAGAYNDLQFNCYNTDGYRSSRYKLWYWGKNKKYHHSTSHTLPPLSLLFVSLYLWNKNGKAYYIGQYTRNTMFIKCCKNDALSYYQYVTWSSRMSRKSVNKWMATC